MILTLWSYTFFCSSFDWPINWPQPSYKFHDVIRDIVILYMKSPVSIALVFAQWEVDDEKM